MMREGCVRREDEYAEKCKYRAGKGCGVWIICIFVRYIEAYLCRIYDAGVGMEDGFDIDEDIDI